MARREVELVTEEWRMRVPFRITGHVFDAVSMLVARVREGGFEGRGEAAGVYYLSETGPSMLADAERVRAAVEAGAGREELLDLLPAGGARNALDCALWDLEAKRSGKSIWALTGIEPREVVSVQTVGIGTPAEMAANARALDTPRIKVKLDGEDPVGRIAAVHAARPDAALIVDVNQGWRIEQLAEFAPRLAELGVEMIEQPLPRGGDEALEGYRGPLPLCADESCLHTGEFEQAARRYQAINIKLDKTGGLTEALRLAALARERGLDLMVGNMMGSSLAMAPAYVIAQLCRWVDLDGALFLERDRAHPMAHAHGVVASPSPALWG